ncbi:MAG: helix-turn-helix transcriptional regulator [Erysipelotrichaceae bacterium]|nr:helix-turn-helix transcriptional regulator [Erysipelotrichaceae bacterium]
MNTYRIARYIRELRKAAGLTQKQLAEKLNISFQAVSKWENGDTLPDTGILLQLCEALNTTADLLLSGGAIVAQEEDILHLDDVIRGFEAIEDVGRYFGEDSTFYLGMVEGINQKMNIDLMTYLKDQRTREVMYAEVLIQGILSGKKVDLDEIESTFTNKKMVETIRSFVEKSNR